MIQYQCRGEVGRFHFAYIEPLCYERPVSPRQGTGERSMAALWCGVVVYGSVRQVLVGLGGLW